MSFTEANFLMRVSGLVSGDGFVREVPVPLSAVISTGADAPALGANIAVVTFDADNESVSVPFQVPLDYDESKDELCVVLTALLTTGDMSALANIMVLDFDQVNRIRPGAAAVADLSALVTSDAQSVDDEAIAQYAFNMSGLSHKVGDVLTIEIDGTETGVAVATIYGVSVRYRSCLCAFNLVERSNIAEEIDNA